MITADLFSSVVQSSFEYSYHGRKDRLAERKAIRNDNRV